MNTQTQDTSALDEIICVLNRDFNIELGGWAYDVTKKDTDKVVRQHFPLVDTYGFIGEIFYCFTLKRWRMSLVGVESWTQHRVRDYLKELDLIV